MKTSLFACSFLAIALASPAFAEEGFGWTGPYIGVLGGVQMLNQADVMKIISGDPVTITASAQAFSGGIEAGYNFQSGNIVYGLEMDASVLSQNSMNISAKDTYNSQLDWYGTLRGRVGIANEKSMVFLTGGLALAQLNIDDQIIGVRVNSGLTPGLAIGAGIEFAISDQVTLKTELMHIEYAKLDYSDSAGFPNTFSTSDNIVNLGINFHF